MRVRDDVNLRLLAHAAVSSLGGGARVPVLSGHFGLQR